MTGLRYVVSFFPGVVVLFAISGFLVSGSMERSKNRKEFFVRRVFRLYPELWVCTLVNLLLLLCLTRQRFSTEILFWCVTQIFGIANTPDCFSNFATGSVNGALWTIFTEVQLYVLLGIFYPLMKKWSKKLWGVIIAAAASANLVCARLAELFPGTVEKIIERTFVPYAVWFLIGCFCWQKREWVLAVLKRWYIPLLVLYALLRVSGWISVGYYTDIATSLLCPLVAIGTAFCFPAKRLRWDFTYGIFLYHWLVLNVMVHFDLINRLPWAVGIFFFTAVTCTAAFLSGKTVGRRVR